MKAQTSAHPCLIVNDKDKLVVLEKIKKAQWAKDTYDSMLERVTSYVKRHKTKPDWILSRYMMNWAPGKHYTDYYSDSIKGNAPYPTVRVPMALRIPVNAEGRKYRLPPIEEWIPHDTSSRMTLINPTTREKEVIEPDGLIEDANGQINGLALDASIIYWLTGKEEYAQFAADILDQFARGAYYQNPIHDRRFVGFLNLQTLNDNSYQSLMLVYDFLFPYLVKKQYEMKYYQPVWEKFAHTVLVNGYRENNWSAAETTMLVCAALLLEDKTKRDFYIDHFLDKDMVDDTWGQLSLRSMVENWLTPDGHWKEPTGYHVYPVHHLLMSALIMENNGYRIFEKYPALFDAASVMMKYIFPDLMHSAFGDAGRAYPSGILLEIALTFAYKYNQEALPALLACMDQLVKSGAYKRERLNAYALLWYLPEIKNNQGYTYQWPRSGTLDYAKFYLQRNGTDKDYGLMYTIQCATYNHCHSNGMSVELYGAGDVMGIDPGKGPTYEHPMHRTYFTKWAAHNTVVAAGSSAFSGGTIGQLEMEAMEPLPGAEAVSPYVSFTDSRYLERSTETNQQRTLALIRTSGKSGYYVDVYRSDNKIRNDYMYHNTGNSIELLTPQGQPIPVQTSTIELVGEDIPGFRHISDVKATGKYSNDVVALFTMSDPAAKPRYMKAYMPKNANQNYYIGYSPSAYSATWNSYLPVPTLMVQNRGEAWSSPFVTIYEPYFGKNGSSVEKVTQLNHENGGDFAVLSVDGKNGEQQYIFQGVNQTGREITAANYSFKGYFGVVSLKNNQVQYIYLGQGKKLAFGDYIIEGEDDNCSVNIDFYTMKVSSNQPVSVTFKQKGIKTVALNSQNLKLTTSASGVMFTVPAVKNGTLTTDKSISVKLAKVTPVITMPPRLVKCGGEDVAFPCTFPEEVAELWFGDVKGVIKSADNDLLTVTIPAETPQGVYDVKVVYNDGKSKTTKAIGKFSIALDAGDYYLWKDITIYAQDYPGVEAKVFCMETGMMVTECWIMKHEILINKNHPEKPFGDGDDQPRGYHHLMLLGSKDRMRLITPSSSNPTFFTCNGTPLTNSGLPPIRYIRIDNEPYRQNTAYPESHGGNTLYTPGTRQTACYNAIKSGQLTVGQWNATTSELAASPPAAGVATVNGVPNTITSGIGFAADVSIFFDNYSTGINPAGGSVGGGIYWRNVEEARIGSPVSLLGGGVLLWAASYGSSRTVNNAQNREMNGALELVSWTGNAGAGAITGSMTLNVFRKKSWNEQHYSYDTSR